MAWNEPGGNDNDPWGNRKNSGGPPDLDEVFKNLKNKLDGLFGQKSGGNSGGNSQSGMPGGSLSARGAGLLAAILAIVWLASGVYTIQPAEEGVVTQFGAYVETTGSGLHWHRPWPFQQVEAIDVEQSRTAQLAGELVLTSDENIVEIEMAVQYNISNSKAYLFNVKTPDVTLKEVMESAVREVIRQTELDSVITIGRDAVGIATQENLQTTLDEYSTGIRVLKVVLGQTQAPEEVQSAFLDVIKAREDKERFINEAQAYRNEVLPRARGDAQQILEESEAYKARVVQASIGESRRFVALLEEYEKAPAVTRDRLYLEAMERVLANTSKVLVDSDSGNNLMYLPIDKIIEQNRDQQQNGSASESSDNSRGSQPPLFSDLPRTVNENARDLSRSRQRGSLR